MRSIRLHSSSRRRWEGFINTRFIGGDSTTRRRREETINIHSIRPCSTRRGLEEIINMHSIRLYSSDGGEMKLSTCTPFVSAEVDERGRK